MRFFNVIILICCFLYNTAFAQKLLSTDLYKNINISKSTELDLNLSIQEKWIILKISNTISSEIDFEVVYNFQNELIYKDKKQNLYWAIGLSEARFKKEISVVHKQKTSFNYNIYQLLTNKAFASNQICKETSFQSDFKELNQGIQRFDFSQIISKCNFSITELFKKKIDELKETFIKLGQFNFADFVSTVKKAFSALIETIPHISTKIIQPLSDLIKAVPKVAESIVCNFTENKIGDIFQAAIVGPVGFSRLAIKTAEDIGQLSHRIYVLTKNGHVSRYLIEAHKSGKLTGEMIIMLDKLVTDIPDNFKRTVKGFASESAFKEHAAKHMKEFSIKNQSDYLEAAKQFAKSVNTNTVIRLRDNGGFVKWNTKTDEFVVLSSQGSIVTYYKQSCKVESDKLLVFLYEGDLSKRTFCKDY